MPKLAMRPYLPTTAVFAAGTDTPRKFLERCLEQIEALEPKVGAFVAMNLAGARAAADRASERWRAGKTLSAIDGMPIGIKDIMETADMPTEQGSPLFKNWRGGKDSAAVSALREAGAVIVGKTVTTEFAATEPRGTRNPWDLERTPGGSSSGSAAAVGCGMLPAALGTQVIGSINRPASFCGCFGFKPSVGGINRGGSYDGLSQSASGTLAATLEEAWVVARTISSVVGGDPGSPGLAGPMTLPTAKRPRTVALLQTAGWSEAMPEAKAALEAVVAQLKAADITVKDRKASPAVETVEAAIEPANPLSRRINAWESRWPLNTYARDMNREGLSKAAQDRLAEAEAMTREEAAELLLERKRVREVYATLAKEFDACITLAAPGPAPVGLGWTGNPIFVVPSSLLGVPAMSLPLMEVQGLPLGLQVIGFFEADAALAATAGGLLGALKR